MQLLLARSWQYRLAAARPWSTSMSGPSDAHPLLGEGHIQVGSAAINMMAERILSGPLVTVL